MTLWQYLPDRGWQTASVTDHLQSWQHKPKSIITSLLNNLCTEKHRSHALTQWASGQIWQTLHFFPTIFYFVETAISTAAEWNRCALSSLMAAEIGYRHGQFVGGMYSTPLYKLYSHLYAWNEHVRPEIWSWKGCQNGNIRSSSDFLVWWKWRFISTCSIV